MTAPISNGPTTHGYTTMRDATPGMMQGGSTYFFWGEAETTSATGAYWDLNSTQLEITGLALQ